MIGLEFRINITVAMTARGNRDDRTLRERSREKSRKRSGDKAEQLNRIWLKSQMAGAREKVKRDESLRNNLKECERRRVCSKRRRHRG